MIQRVYCVIETGLTAPLLAATPVYGPIDIPADFHPYDERVIARVLRQMADELEGGMSFVGVDFVARNHSWTMPQDRLGT